MKEVWVYDTEWEDNSEIRLFFRTYNEAKTHCLKRIKYYQQLDESEVDGLYFIYSLKSFENRD